MSATDHLFFAADLISAFLNSVRFPGEYSTSNGLNFAQGAGKPYIFTEHLKW